MHGTSFWYGKRSERGMQGVRTQTMLINVRPGENIRARWHMWCGGGIASQDAERNMGILTVSMESGPSRPPENTINRRHERIHFFVLRLSTNNTRDLTARDM